MTCHTPPPPQPGWTPPHLHPSLRLRTKQEGPVEGLVQKGYQPPPQARSGPASLRTIGRHLWTEEMSLNGNGNNKTKRNSHIERKWEHLIILIAKISMGRKGTSFLPFDIWDSCHFSLMVENLWNIIYVERNDQRFGWNVLTMATRNKDFMMKQATHHGNKEQGLHDEAGYSPWQQGTRISWWSRLLTMATSKSVFMIFKMDEDL